MKLRKIIATILTGTAVLASVAGCGSTASTGKTDTAEANSNVTKSSSADASSSSVDTSDWKPVNVSIGVDSSVFSAQLRIADQAGLFKKYKINADLVNYSYGIDTINGVILNEVQVGEANDYAVATRAAEGSNLRLASSILSGQGDSKTLYANKADIKTGADLKGKSVAVGKGTVNEFEWAKTLETFGLKNSDVKELPFSSDAEILAAYQSGKVDAMWGSKQFDSQISQVSGSHSIATLADIDQVNIAYLVVDKTFYEQNEDAVERIILALNDASDIINNDKDQAAKYVAASLGIAESDARSGLDTYNYEIRFNKSDVDHVLDVADWSIKNGLIEKAYDLSKYVETGAIKKVLPDKTDL